MKNILKLCVLFMICAILWVPRVAQAQGGGDRVFQPFKLGMGLFTGYAFGGSTKTEAYGTTKKTSGVAGFSILYLEPQYGLTDNIDVGFRAEYFLVGGGSSSVNG